MKSLLDEMQQCKSVKDCIELASVDAYGDEELAGAWLTCIEEMFGRFDRVKVMGQDVALVGFDLANGMAVVAECRQGKRTAKIALESVEFPSLTPIEARWLQAWKRFSQELG